MDYIAYMLLGSLAIATVLVVTIMTFVPDEQDQQNR